MDHYNVQTLLTCKIDNYLKCLEYNLIFYQLPSYLDGA
jgi:hypothetical protein